MFEPVSVMSHTFKDLGGSMRFTIPSRKEGSQILIAPIFLVGWWCGLRTFGPMIMGTYVTEIDSFTLAMLGWLIIWTLGGLAVILGFLWIVAGRDVLEVDAMSVKWRREIFGIGRTREFVGEAFRDLRVSHIEPPPWWMRRTIRPNYLFEGPLTFNYGAKMYRFGGVDDAEAYQIVQRIRERYPQYIAAARN
jgi:hypothetical protein